MYVHDGVVGATDGVHGSIIMNANNQKVPSCLGTFQQLDMTQMKQVERTIDVHNFVTGLKNERL
jgi:hypothetical protein